MPRRLFAIITVAVFAGGALAVRLPAQAPAQSPASTARPTPVGTPTENGLAGFAKILCSAVFISGREPAEAARNSAYFFMPRAEQDQVTFSIDREARSAQASFNGITREARQYGDQGCIIQNSSSPGIHFKPVPVRTTLPDGATQPWPMGDRADSSPWPAAVDKSKIDAALDAAFADPAALTAAFLVLHKGRIVGERYAAGITKDTQLESWSMGKSITATLFALLVADGTYSLEQPAPVPLWRQPNDPRGQIRNIDLLRMSAGLRFVGNQEPGGSPANTVLDHYFIYTGATDAFNFSITRPLEVPPNTQGRYRNCDPLTIGYLIKLAVQQRAAGVL